MTEVVSISLAGIVLGLSAGLAPGPMLTLVLSETLRQGSRAGLLVALSPLVSDVPIVLLSLLLLTQLAQVDLFLAVISFLGAAVLVWMGFESLRTKALTVAALSPTTALKKGVLVNLLNPHPYVFWLTIGGPFLLKAAQHSWLAVGLFLLSFYSLLVGSKIVLALLVGRYRHFLSGKLYLYSVRGLGLMLWLFAIWLVWDGIQLLTTLKTPL